jgi:hypothetical protein
MFKNLFSKLKGSQEKTTNADTKKSKEIREETK